MVIIGIPAVSREKYYDFGTKTILYGKKSITTTDAAIIRKPNGSNQT